MCKKNRWIVNAFFVMSINGTTRCSAKRLPLNGHFRETTCGNCFVQFHYSLNLCTHTPLSSLYVSAFVSSQTAQQWRSTLQLKLDTRL